MLKPLSSADRQTIAHAAMPAVSFDPDDAVRVKLTDRLSENLRRHYCDGNRTVLMALLNQLAIGSGADRERTSFRTLAIEHGLALSEALTACAAGVYLGVYALFPDPEAPWAAAFWAEDGMQEYPEIVLRGSPAWTAMQAATAAINPPV